MSIKKQHFRGIGRKLEALLKGLPYATIRPESAGVPIYLEFLDEGKSHLALTVGGERQGYKEPLAQIVLQSHQIRELQDLSVWVSESIRVSPIILF